MTDRQSNNKVSKFLLDIFDRVGFCKKARKKTTVIVQDHLCDTQFIMEPMERLFARVDERKRKELLQEANEAQTTKEMQTSRTAD